MTAPIGPYSPLVRAGPWLACSGQLGLRDGALVPGLRAQTGQALANLAALLEQEGASLADVVKTTVFVRVRRRATLVLRRPLTDVAGFADMNEAYVEAFAGHRPARSTVAVVALPLGAEVEVEAWAYRLQRD